ncbi:MAG: hypothetical protein AAF532_11945 [Planctomycetota bacterium]
MVAVLGGGPVSAAPPLPGDINAVVAIDVGGLLQTSRAVENRWAERSAERLAVGEATVPPWTATVLSGTIVRPGREEPTWTTCVVTTHSPDPIDGLLTEADADETLAGFPIRYGDDRIYVRTGPTEFAVVRPAVRQEAARWLRGDRVGSFSPYLLEALGRGLPFLMALDTADLFSPAIVAEGLAAEGFEGVELRAATAGFTQLAGVSLEVVVDDAIHGRIRLSYDGTPPVSPDLAKEVFLATMADLGLSLPAFESATAITVENEIELDAILDDHQLRQITLLALFSRRDVAGTGPAGVASSAAVPGREAVPEDRVAKQTERYLEKIKRMVRDFERAVETAGPRSNLSGWGDRYADRLLDLPIEDVDVAAIEFGNRAAQRFRALSASMRGQIVRVDAAEGSIVIEQDFRPGWVNVGPWNVGWQGSSVRTRSSNLASVRGSQREAIIAGADERQQIWTDLKADLDDVTRRLAVKYGFDPS